MESDNKKIQLNKKEFPSELRYDLVSRDWVVIATGRAKRPEMFKEEKKKREVAPKSRCPFCNLGTQEKPTLAFNFNIIPRLSFKEFKEMATTEPSRSPIPALGIV